MRTGASAFVGRVMERGIASVPRVVAHASGLDEPSTAACVAGVIRGTTVLAQRTLGPVAGTCVDVAGTAAVLVIATWSVRGSAGEASFRAELAETVLAAERRGFCSPAVGYAVRRVTTKAAVDAKPVIAAVGAGAVRRGVVAVVGRVEITRVLLRAVSVATIPTDVWSAIGSAARLVDELRADRTRPSSPA